MDELPTGATTSSSGRLHQRHGDVEVSLDGNAHAWAWTPNTSDSDERLLIDLLPDLAQYCHLGRGRPPAAATWEDTDTMTLLVSVDSGAAGAASIGGDLISEAAVADLAAFGVPRRDPHRQRSRTPTGTGRR